MHYPVIYNANAADELQRKKRALLLYIVKPFLLQDNDPQLLRHQNARQCRQIAALLDELGYIVDAVYIRDREFRPAKNYDLIISNRADDTFFAKDSLKIYLATTLCHDSHNKNLRRRHQLLSERRNCKIKIRRRYGEIMPYVVESDAIICFGNEFIANSWRKTFKGPIYPFNNYGFKETEFLLDAKDFRAARKNFLFFASGSQVQKGLDLLLEVFPKHPELHLYICSDFKTEEDFCACYHQELYETPNIHPIGRVRVNGPEFYELVRQCACVVHPSCSEGQTGSVVQCMYSGLIPLVTRETGIDIEDFGVTFPNDSLAEIERVIIEISQRSESWHREHSIRTRRVSEEKYSEDAFAKRWRTILTEILGVAGDQNDRAKMIQVSPDDSPRL
jgi:glycosyltransferase involved in cell wall biosynthesis